MRALEFCRWALSVSVAAALLGACSGSSIPHAGGNATADAAAPKNSKTFRYTGAEQRFIVPEGVSQLTVVARGGEGGGFSIYPSSDNPGFPGRVHATIPVHPADILYVFVGGSGTHGGFNGGGAAGAPGRKNYPGNPGGGASDIRVGGDTVNDRIIVAAGGGGAGQAVLTYGHNDGGNGGGLAGKSGGGGGSSYDAGGGGGGGGTQSEGGSGGTGGLTYYSKSGQPGGNGALGLGGSGGNGICTNAGGGGGGGGGYYGGGGGGGGGNHHGTACYSYSEGQGGGGGGGSSYVEASAIKSRMWTGWKSKGDGLVIFTWK